MRVTNALSAVGSLIVLCAVPVSGDLAKQVLFGLGFGGGTNEVAVWYNHEMGDPSGIGDLSVDWSGRRIHIVESRQTGNPPALLTFSRSGRLLRRVDLGRWLEDAWRAASSPSAVYVTGVQRTEPPTQPWSEGPQAVVVCEDASDAPRLIRQGDVPRGVMPSGARFIGEVECDRNGNLLWYFSDTGEESRLGAVRFSARGGFLGALDGVEPATRDGSRLTWKTNGTGRVKAVTVVGSDLDEVRRFRVSRDAPAIYAASGDPTVRSVWEFWSSRCLLSAGGWAYISAMRRLTQPREIDLRAHRGLWHTRASECSVRISFEQLVLVYSPAGEFVGAATFAHHPFAASALGYVVDSTGALYQTDFHPDRLDIVQWKPSK